MAKNAKSRPGHRRGMRRAATLALLLCLSVPALPSATGAPPNDIFLFFDLTTDTDLYVRTSTVEAWAALNFSGNPDPPGQVDNIEFRWWSPNGTLAATATVDPSGDGWALSTHRVTSLGTWAVNATYVGTPRLSTNRTFQVVPDAWGPGTVTLGGSTMVGGNATLTIAPGTTVQSATGVRIRVKGGITAIGTPALPILFTSNAGTPSPGDWHSLIFLPEGGNRTTLDQVRVQYAEDGVRVSGAAPQFANVYVADTVRYGFRLTNVQARLFGVGAARTLTGFWIDGGTVTLENATAREVSNGVLAFGGSLSVRNGVFESVTQVGLNADGTRLDLSGVTFDGGPVGLRLTAATGGGDGLAFLSLDDAVSASGSGTNATLWNSTFGTARLRHVHLMDNARLTAVNATFPSGGERVSVSGGAELELRNFLRVRATSYDNGTDLGGVAVDVTRDGVTLYQGRTLAGGLTPLLILPYRRYAPSASDTTIRVRATLPGVAFEDNDRTFVLSTSRTERFRGSTEDLDEDGEPDFSDADIDGDGLDNAAEALLGTDPRRIDTDGDGMPDGWEFDHGLDARTGFDRLLDEDGDDLANYEEYLLGTDPRTADTDGDRMPDGWEVRNGLDPMDPSDADQDADGDGFTNLEEYRAGTDPNDPTSFPRPDALESTWPFVVALVVAVAIIGLSLVLGRRRRKRAGAREAAEDEDADEGDGGDES